MGLPIIAGIGSQKGKAGNLTYPITTITGTATNNSSSFNLTAPWRIGENELYATDTDGEPLTYNLSITFDNTALVSNATLFENADFYAFNIAICSRANTQINRPYGGVASREFSPAPQLIAVLTTGLPKTLFLQAGGTFTVNIPFAPSGSADNWVLEGGAKLPDINTCGLGFLENDNEPLFLQFTANLTNDLGIISQSQQTIFARRGRIQRRQPETDVININSFTTTTTGYGVDIFNLQLVPENERLVSVANAGNSFAFPEVDIDGNIGIAEYYDDTDPSVKINGNFVINYDATGVNAGNFPELLNVRIVVNTFEEGTGLYDLGGAELLTPFNNQVIQLTGLPKEIFLAPESSINLQQSYGIEEGFAFRWIFDTGNTFVLTIQFENNDGLYVSSNPVQITVASNSVSQTVFG